MDGGADGVKRGLSAQSRFLKTKNPSRREGSKEKQRILVILQSAHGAEAGTAATVDTEALIDLRGGIALLAQRLHRADAQGGAGMVLRAAAFLYAYRHVLTPDGLSVIRRNYTP